MRVLIVEDDSATAMAMEVMMKSAGFNAYTTDLGEKAIELARLYDYDLITLDLNLPDMSGFDVLHKIRAAGVKTPVIIVTGSSRRENEATVLSAGADDYLRKPVDRDVLLARIHAVVRRSKGHAQSVIRTGEIAVNLDTKTVEVNGLRVNLTGKEYQLLELLSLRKGATLSKEMFVNHLYGGMDEPEIKIVDVFICKLRKKLAAAANGAHHIHTVWGQGYALRDDSPNLVQKVSLPRPSGADVAKEAIGLLAGGCLGSTRLSVLLGINQTRARHILFGLVEKGLVKARRDLGHDSRRYIYDLTEAGRATLEHERKVA